MQQQKLKSEVHLKSLCTTQNKAQPAVRFLHQIRNVIGLCRWGRGSSHGSGVATLDGDTKAQEEESHGPRLPGCGGNPTAEVADEFRRFLSQRAQCLDGDWDKVVRRHERAVLGPLPCFTLRGNYSSKSRKQKLPLKQSNEVELLCSYRTLASPM